MEMQQFGKNLVEIFFVARQVFAQEIQEVFAQTQRIHIGERYGQALSERTLEIDVEILGVRRIIDNGEALQIAIRIKFAVDEDAVLADRDPDRALVLVMPDDHQEDGQN